MHPDQRIALASRQILVVVVGKDEQEVRSIRIDGAIALGRGVASAGMATLIFETQCMRARRAAVVTALLDPRLEYEDQGLLTGQGVSGCAS